MRIAGWMPRASARSSARASTTSASASARSSSTDVPSVGEPSAGELEREPDPEQALLRSVVEVALDAPPLGVARLDDPRAGGAHLGELGAQLGLQARVLEREARCCAHRLDELGIVEERRVMDESCEALPVVLEHRDGARGLGLRDERVSVGIDVALLLGQPESELERGIAERARDRVTNLRGSRQRPELDHQLGHGRAVQPRAQEAGEEGERDRSGRNDHHPAEQAPGRISGGDTEPDGEGGEEKPESDSCPAHGGDRAPGRGCRTAPPSDEKTERRQHDRQVDRDSHELQPLGYAGIALEQEQVARAIRTTGVNRVPEE